MKWREAEQMGAIKGPHWNYKWYYLLVSYCIYYESINWIKSKRREMQAHHWRALWWYIFNVFRISRSSPLMVLREIQIVQYWTLSCLNKESLIWKVVYHFRELSLCYSAEWWLLKCVMSSQCSAVISKIPWWGKKRQTFSLACLKLAHSYTDNSLLF